MPKIPSLQQLFTGLAVTLKRFPLEILFSLVGSVAFIMAIEVNYNEDVKRELLIRLILVSILGLTLMLPTSLYAERKNLSGKNSILVKVLAAAVVVGLFFFLKPIDSIVSVFRYGFLVAAFHLLVSFAPFIGEKNIAAFWEYNKRLFLRILLSGLYSTVLFAGLCIALLSVDTLFNLNFDETLYGDLAAVVYGIFNTAFFLAGVPANWVELEESHVYPKGLKIFTQFVLIPLATIYFCILLAYEGKLIITWSLPEGLVSSLVLGYAVYGILAILLVYPIRNEADTKWIQSFARLFYVLLIPLIVLLGIAIFTRVIEYGITEPRYILVVLSIWLTGITAFFLLTRSENIKVIPISLCFVALISVWGPQSATHISMRSQMNALIDVFEKNNAYKDGVFNTLPNTTSKEDAGQADDIIHFIVNRGSFEPFRNHIHEDVDSLNKVTKNNQYTQWGVMIRILGAQTSNQSDYVFYTANSNTDTIAIQHYDYLTRVHYNEYDTENGDEQKFKWNTSAVSLTVKISGDAVQFELKELFDRIKTEDAKNKNNTVEISDLKTSFTSRKATYSLVFDNISFSITDGKYVLKNFDAYLLVGDQ